MAKMTPVEQVVRIGLLVGAAKDMATPEQLQGLRTTVIPACSDDAWLRYGTEELIISAIREVMGANWTPSPFWQERIARVSSGR